MKKNTVAVLDVGSDKITVAVAEKNINNTFVIKGYSSKKYDGFLNGEFLDYIGLEDAVLSTVKQALLSAKEELSLLYVGVPGEFTTVYLKEAQTSFPKPTRLDLNDLSAFYDGAYDVNTKKYTPINRSGEYFVLDEGRKVVNPVGEVCRVLNGKLSYILCENTFINTITPILNKLGDIKIEYVSSALAEALYLFSPEERDKTSILLDVGHLTTTFAIIKGDAVVYQRSFAFGGGFINFALVEKLDIDDDIAEKLKRKINLSCEYADDDEYVVIDGDKEYRFSAKTVNDVVFETLDVLCDYLGDCFAGVKLTGRVLESVRGWLRLLGDGALLYAWEMKYLIPAEQRPLLQTHRTAQMSDDELCCRLRGEVMRIPAG